MKYQLFDTESGNLVGQYLSRDDALRVVLESFNKFGSQWASDLALHEDAFGAVASLGVKTPSGPVIAEGKALIELARSTAPRTRTGLNGE